MILQRPMALTILGIIITMMTSPLASGAGTRALSRQMMMKNKGKGHGNKYKIDPETWYVGLWKGIDPLDGAEYVREFVPVPGESNKFMFTGSLEFSQICAAGPPGGGGGNAEVPEDAPDARIPARLNGYGAVDMTTNVLKVVAGLTCFGANDPLVAGIPVDFVPVGQDLLMEVPSFRANAPIYLHRISPYYTALHYY